MKTIWKYKLLPDTPIHMPVGAQILDVQEQHGDICIWALVDPTSKTVPRLLKVYGTGHDITDDPGRYIGTFQLKDSGLVFHVFDGKKGKVTA